MRRVAVLLLANAAIALAATYDLTCPGCFGLSAIHDINNSGTFVGSYGFGVQQGLLCSSGVCTTINFPGAAQTEAHGINDSGLIAGTYTGGNFLYDGTNFTTLTVSGPVQGINNSGQLVGFFGNHGFLDDGGVITSIDVPGAVQTQAMGINNSGQIVGDYQDGAGVNHGFLLSGGVLTILDAPGATSAPNVFGRAGTDANGINDNGDIVGEYQDALGTVGYLFSGGVFTALDIPSFVCCDYTAHDVHAYGVNNQGQIVGYKAQSTVQAGYLATPDVPEPRTLPLLAIGLIGIFLCAFTSRNARNELP